MKRISFSLLLLACLLGVNAQDLDLDFQTISDADKNLLNADGVIGITRTHPVINDITYSQNGRTNNLKPMEVSYPSQKVFMLLQRKQRERLQVTLESILRINVFG